MEDLLEGRVLRRSHFPKKKKFPACMQGRISSQHSLNASAQITNTALPDWSQNLAASVVPFSRARPCLPFE